MSEIEYPTKTCMQCGTKCDLLVFVCPNCSWVLPDAEPSDNETPVYEFPSSALLPSALPPNALPASSLPRHELTSDEISPSVIPENTTTDLALGKVILFLIAFAVLLWLVSTQMSQSPG